ncbi:MAG TPA: hypothetical protein VF799_08760 [Geobacteraceae bacterium]
MRKVIVRSGMNLLLAAIVPLILVTFYHEPLASLFRLSPGGEVMLVYLGFFWSAMMGCMGILVTVIGLARNAGKGPSVRLAPSAILLVVAIVCYFFLLYSSLTSTESPKLRPGETITI